jgi:phosphoribosylformylglycinamidine cyclo-ligase
VKGLSHITGGGLSENIPRVMPAGLAAHIDLATFRMPPVFGWLQRAGNLDNAEMLRTFNCGIGMIVIVDPARASDVMTALKAAGEAPRVIGAVEPGRGVKSSAKGKGEAEAVRYSGALTAKGCMAMRRRHQSPIKSVTLGERRAACRTCKIST